LGFALCPQTPNPNPQSPIPNPQFQKFLKKKRMYLEEQKKNKY